MEFSSGGVKKLVKNKKSKKSLVPIIEPFLPYEIIFEILSWLPVDSLLRFKRVSKQWHSLIQDRHFIIKHMIQSKPVTYSYKQFLSLEKMDRDNCIVSCRCGLVLKMNYHSMQYGIRNPGTCQILDLPDPQNFSHGMELFNVPNTIDFKVVSVFMNEDDNEDCEILTVGTDEQWRPLKLPRTCNIGKTKLLVELDAVHFIRLITDGSNLCIRVDSLDKESECFSTSILPQGFFSNLKKVSGISWYGRLAFADIMEKNLNVMVLENCKEQKWSERKTIGPLTFWKEDQGISIPYAARSGNLRFSIDETDRVFSYDIISEEIRDARPGRWWVNASYIIHPSLITFKGMQPECLFKQTFSDGSYSFIYY